jgi:hypothetical protein
VVSFDAPKNPKAPVTSYSATATNDTEKNKQALSEKSKGSATGIVLPKCVTGNSYTITVVATYGAKNSGPAKIGNPWTCKK